MCAICDILAMRVVEVTFSTYPHPMPDEERQRIKDAVEAAYDGTNRRAYVIDANLSSYVECPAYAAENGKQAVVHIGHCTGAFDGIEKCMHFDVSKDKYARNACRLRVRRGLA